AGTAQLVVNGEVVAVATGDDLACESSLLLLPECSDAADGSLWLVDNGSDRSTDVRLALNGATVESFTLAPAGRREVSFPSGGRLEAFEGSVLRSRSDSRPEPCASVSAVCFAPGAGHVWAVAVSRRGSVEVRIGGAFVGSVSPVPDLNGTLVTSS